MKKILTIIISFTLLLSCANKKEINEITFALDWTPNTNHTGIYVAKNLGIYEKYGIKINIVQPSMDSADILVATKRADFGVSFQPNLIHKLIKKLPITAVASIIPHNTAGIMILSSKNTKSVKDLKDLRYASWEDKVDDTIVKNIVGTYKKIPLGDVYSPLEMMQNDIFDYIISFYAWDGINAKVRGIDVDFYFFKDSIKEIDYYSPIITANNSLLKDNPELAKRFLKATREGYEYAIAYPEKAAKILLKEAPELDEKLVLESQKWISKRYKEENKAWGYIDMNRWNSFYRYLYDNKIIENKIKDSYGVSNEYLEY